MNILAYYYPGWSKERNLDEWAIVKSAKHMFPGHKLYTPRHQYFIEDKEATELAVDVAERSGIAGYTFLLYWDQGKTSLDVPLRQFSEACKHRNDLKFSILWVNRAIHRSFPVVSSRGGQYEPSPDRLVETSFVDLERLLEFIDFYSNQASYYKIGGKPLFQIYDFLGVYEQLELWKASNSMRFSMLLANYFFIPILPNHTIWPWMRDLPEITRATSNYVLLPDFTSNSMQDYRDCCQMVYHSWESYPSHTGIPHIPSITVGWDATPRSAESIVSQHHRTQSYPRWPIVIGNTVEAFSQHLGQGLQKARTSGFDLVFLSSLNEWSEGHFIEPDMDRGESFLQAIRSVVESDRILTSKQL